MPFILQLLTLPLAAFASALLAGDVAARLLGRTLAFFRRRPAAVGRDHTRASIIIVTWNGRDLLAQGLPSVLAAVAQAGGEHEIIVVDNGSGDGSADLVRTAFPTVRLLALPQNVGFGPGNNTGVQAASHDIVVLLNNDMVVEPGFLRPLLQPFADERVFAVSAQIRMGDPARQRVETGLTRGELRDGRFVGWHGDIAADEQQAQPCLWAGGGSGAFDRRRFLELGGFASLYAPFYVEDVDLSYRAWKRGWSVLLAPRSVVYHRHRASTARLGHDYVEQAFAKNCRLFVWHNVTDVAWTLSSLLRLPGDLATALKPRALKQEQEQENERRALWWALRQLPAAAWKRWQDVARVERAGLASVPSDRAIFLLSCSRYHYKERFLPPPAPPADGRKRILIVCPYFPAPPAHGGAVRMLNLIKHLASGNDVDVLSFIDSEAERQYTPLLAPHCRQLRLVPRLSRQNAYRPLHDRGWLIEEFNTPEMRQALLEMLGAEDYHVLLVEYTQMALYYPGTRRCRTVLDEVEVYSRSFYRRQIAGQRPPGRQDIADYLKLFRFELESCRRFDHVLAMSNTDAAYLAGYLPERRAAIAEVANGVDTRFYTAPDEWPGGKDLLFVGSHRHTPNQDGMRWFLRDVFPLIRRQAPDVHLYIVGDGPWVEMDGIAGEAAITATGFVDDTRPYLARCAVSLAPILTGAGTRIKILESLAAGIPIVSTTLGAEGIAVRPGDDMLIADDATAFAAATLRILHEPGLAERLRRNGRRLVEEKYDWQAIVARLDQLLTASVRAKL